MANSSILTRKIRATFKVALILFLLFVQGCSWYSKPAYRGRVVDAETGQPLSQVHIVIRYDISVNKLIEQGSKQITTFYIITGKDGSFSVPPVRSFIGPLSSDFAVFFSFDKSGYANFSANIADCMSTGCDEIVIPYIFEKSKKIFVSSNLIRLPKL
ncbi:hypothetical protein [Desulfuromonas soudanensis]|uniref:hypothetical protein n=1 Tax=Desulfuromonas soudanensis TaxID=1603606 RepID=UPI0012FA6563|nr:hypothetical protein [Desulfuromonas soudanensis]